MKSPAVVNIGQAKAQFSRLLVRVSQGEQITIAKAGKPMACLAPVPDQPKRRVPGTAKGKIWMAPDFHEPLPNEIIDQFAGGSGLSPIAGRRRRRSESPLRPAGR